MSEVAVTQAQADLLVQSVTDYAIYMLDQDGIVRSWNAGAERFKGYRAEEIIGEHFSRFYTQEDREAGMPAKALNTALTEGRFEAEGWRVRKGGSRFWASVVIDPIRDEERHVGFAKITRDLTERKGLQDALEHSREQFFQAQKMEAIGQLTGGVAHDFNNILAAIIGSVSLAQRRLEQGKDIDKFLDNAIQAARRGATLTQRMLAFARKQELELEPVDMIDAVRGMAELLARTIGQQIHITTRFPLSLPAVMADRTQLELALINLVVNARDAMPRGGTIRLGAEEVRDDEGREFVRLTVEDEGTGMDAETLARAADPFFTTKGVGKGTGLGLPMVQGMVEQCGGHFRLHSEPERGTRAEVWLPVTEAVPRGPAEADPERHTAGGSLRILAVDDDPIVLLNTCTVLADFGHTVISAHSGPAALAELANHPIDLLLTDYAMPGMTGVELADQARKAQPGLKVLIVSGYADLPKGAELNLPRLAKPFSDADLASTIAAVAAAAP